MKQLTAVSDASGAGALVLVTEDDEVVRDMLGAILLDQGYRVAVVEEGGAEALRYAVARSEPDCVLLDGRGLVPGEGPWADAAWLHRRGRPVPAVLLTARRELVDEAKENDTARSRAAGFAGVMEKPFRLDLLLEAVARAVGRSVPFDESPGVQEARTVALVEKLTTAGLRDVRTSLRPERREWATYYLPDGTLGMLFWSAPDGAYHVARVDAGGLGLHPIGRFYDLDAAIAGAVAGS